MMRSSYQKFSFGSLALAFALGLSGELYWPMPGLGVMSFIEIFSYAACTFLVIGFWSKMGRNTRRTILFGLAWALSAALAGLFSGLPLKACLKEVVVCCSSWAIVSVSWFILRKNSRLYLVYLIGAGIGSYIGLYYFKQGVWLYAELRAENAGKEMLDVLIDKQVFPIYANAIFYGCVLPLFVFSRKFPAFLVMVGCFYSGFYLLIHGGSRSVFGFYVLAAMTMFGIVYAKRMAKIILRSKMTMLCVGMTAVILIFLTYKIMAKSGGLGDTEKDKYEEQFQNAESGRGGLIGRGSYVEALKIFITSPWGIGPKFGTHSVLTSAMIKEGIMGLVFWIFYFSQIAWFMSKRLVYSGKYSAFIMLMMTNAVWSALGSPFGARHVFFVTLAFISLCRDNALYGMNGVFEFDGRYLSRMSRGRSLTWRF